MSIFNVISLCGGLALFLYGMRVMGDGLKQGSSGALKKAMAMVTGNPFLGFLLGFLVTGVIQSSHATIVLTAGLVSAGIITLHQSIGIIIGANLGTTVTGQIIRLLDLNGDAAAWIKIFQPSTLAPVAAIIGIIFIYTSKSKRSNLVGNTLLGFGILFTGLLNMTSAVSPLSQSESFTQLFTSFADRPVLGYIVGACAAFGLQSSSATIGILQALASTGKLTFGSIYSIIVGIYLGDCVTTAIVCSIGAVADAKRTGIIHVLYGISKSILILVLITILHHLGVLDSMWNTPITSGGIANAHTLFNLIAAAVLLPICTIFERASYKIVKDAVVPETETTRLIASLNKSLFASPELAFQAVQNCILHMAKLARENVSASFDQTVNYDEKKLEEIDAKEDDLDSLTDHVSDYLGQMAPYVREGNASKRHSYYVKCVSEFERIGDLAVNISENAEHMHERGTIFTNEAKHEMDVVRAALEDIMNHTIEAFEKQTIDDATYIEPIEEVIDDLVATMKSNHFARVQDGECNLYNGYIFIDILTNVERVSDQCANIGVHTVSLCDDKIADQEHEFIKRLHAGEDADFNRRYALYKEMYYGQITPRKIKQ